MAVPDVRIAVRSGAPVRPDGDYVLYWMNAYRRPRYNFALDRAVELAREMGTGLVVLEALRCDYSYASERLHKFILDGMRDNAEAFASTSALYYPYVEPEAGAGKGLIQALSARACAVVTDDYPVFFLPAAVKAAAARVEVRLEAVDSVGVLPMAETERAFTTAYAFRRFLQKNLAGHLDVFPLARPLAVSLPKDAGIPEEIKVRWPEADAKALRGETLSSLPIDHSVRAVPRKGGWKAGLQRAGSFVSEKLPEYATERNHPDADATSGLSPYLHFGHVSAYEVFAMVAEAEGWSRGRLSGDVSGARQGWWGMSESAEAFLDQLVTWRELGFNFCHHEQDYASYASLPAWARSTLEQHGRDARNAYPMERLEVAETDDEVWNAAQRQLMREGVVHNYLRMIWGKRLLEWSLTAEEALERMIYLNDRYAIDGRDPNSYSGIAWCLGRYDRAWGPERAIFGKVRYMSSENTLRKLRMKEYLEKFS